MVNAIPLVGIETLASLEYMEELLRIHKKLLQSPFAQNHSLPSMRQIYFHAASLTSHILWKLDKKESPQSNACIRRTLIEIPQPMQQRSTNETAVSIHIESILSHEILKLHFVGCSNGEIFCYDESSLTLKLRFKDGDGAIDQLAYYGRFLVTHAKGKECIMFWSFLTQEGRRPRRVFQLDSRGLNKYGFKIRDNLLLTASMDENINVRKLTSNDVITVNQVFGSSITGP